eukprot:TRINITY_DN13547_c0_g1_i1.p1 TRINITY_DN13547_c0_g1~~TRINITY_DN13547_c0_g1_i1.p1  ORF type:complete len:229 (+),score=41.77 TRINITY_DN13547_c0_g1_i1:108-794(+)
MSHTVVLYGGAGQLGSIILSEFKKANWKTISVDFRPNPDADQNIQLKGASVEEDTKHVKSQISGKIDALISAAGGWEGGSIDNDNIFSQVDKMWKFNVQSALAASHVAAHFLKENGLLVLTGGTAAYEPTPGYVGYGMSKAATHHLITSLAHPDSKLPKGSVVVGLVPIILDTAMNRSSMPNADFSTWTPLSEVAKKLLEWSQKHPGNGECYSPKTSAGKTEWTKIKN